MKSSVKVLGVIPCRLTATRLPGKPLLEIAGKPMVQRVWEQAKKATLLSSVIVATDSSEIAASVKGFGGEVVMTSSDLATGSDRVYAAAKLYQIKSGGETVTVEGDWKVIVNVQGDMPLIEPAAIDSAVQFLLDNTERFEMVTVAVPIFSKEDFNKPQVVKVVTGENFKALYFSRSAIPHPREDRHLELAPHLQSPETKNRTLFGYKHIGLYAYKPEALEKFCKAKQSELELVEKLEQLRLFDCGVSIGVCLLPEALFSRSVEVDTPSDLARARELASK